VGRVVGRDKDFGLFVQTQTEATPFHADHAWFPRANHADVAPDLQPDLLQTLEMARISRHVNDHPVIFGFQGIERNGVRGHNGSAGLSEIPNTILSSNISIIDLNEKRSQ
jgi:hypothetical protein